MKLVTLISQFTIIFTLIFLSITSIASPETETNHTQSNPDEEPSQPKVLLAQNGKIISHSNIDPTKDLVVKWSESSSAKDVSNNTMSKRLIVTAYPCDEKRKHLFTSDLIKINNNPTTHKHNDAFIPAGTLKPNTWHWLKIEFSNRAQTSALDNAPANAKYMTATYLAIRTHGAPMISTCTHKMKKSTKELK